MKNEYKLNFTRCKIITSNLYKENSIKTEGNFLRSGNNTKLKNKSAGEFVKMLADRLYIF